MHSGMAASSLLGGNLGSLGAFRPAGRLRLDTRLLAAQTAQVIELGAAHLATAHDLDRVDHRREQWEHALDAFAVRNLAHGEALVDAAAGTADAHALVGLDAALVAFDHLDVDQHGVARREIGNVLAGRELLDLLFIDLLDDVHGEVSVGSASNRRAVLSGLNGLGELLRQSSSLVTLAFSARFRAFYGPNRPPRGPAGAHGSAARPRRGARPRPWRGRRT